MTICVQCGHPHLASANCDHPVLASEYGMYLPWLPLDRFRGSNDAVVGYCACRVLLPSAGYSFVWREPMPEPWSDAWWFRMFPTRDELARRTMRSFNVH